tara:strand:+ start:44 stop:532 length:489 start_codon:yes stop_codon:yes gene_type:complete
MKRYNKKHWGLGAYEPFPKDKDMLRHNRGSITEDQGYHCGEELYETFLEIGLDKQINHRLFALCVLVDDLDQLLEYIKKQGTYPVNVLAEAFLSKWASLKKEVDQSVKDSAEKKADYATEQLAEEEAVLDALKPGMDLLALQKAFDTFGDDEDKKENIDHKP